MKLYVADIEIELIRKNIKNMHLYVLRPDGKIRVTAPFRLSEEKIISFISSRIDWIKEQQEKLNAEPHVKPITYSSGDKLIIFGNTYILDVIESQKNSFIFFDGKAELYCKSNATKEQRQAIVEKALRAALYEKVKPLLEKWESITQLKASSFQIKKMKTRWGTCNTRTKKIWLNFELVTKQTECIEYVIMHELAHLSVPNHGKDFIYIMQKYMPSWQALRDALNDNSNNNLSN